jgi:HPt (histidine-containing phosphotransfer) domain-containing protein
MSEILALFLEESKDRLMRLRTLVPDRDATEIGREAHSLKGAAATLGLMRLSEQAATLEAAIKCNQAVDLTRTIEQMEAEFREGEIELSKKAEIAA